MRLRSDTLGLGGNGRHVLHVMLRLFLMSWLSNRLDIGLRVMSRSGRLLLRRIDPLLYRLVVVSGLLNMRGIFVGRLFVHRLVSGRLLLRMGLRIGWLRLLYMRLVRSVMLFRRRMLRLLLHCRRFRNRLFSKRQRLRMLGFHLNDRGFQLVELTAQHLLRRARLHALKLPLNGTASPLVNLDPHLGSIIGQAIHGPSNDCYKIRHQYFLMMPGTWPDRDSSLIRDISPQTDRSQVWCLRAQDWSKASLRAHRSAPRPDGHI